MTAPRPAGDAVARDGQPLIAGTGDVDRIYHSVDLERKRKRRKTVVLSQNNIGIIIVLWYYLHARAVSRRRLIRSINDRRGD